MLSTGKQYTHSVDLKWIAHKSDSQHLNLVTSHGRETTRNHSRRRIGKLMSDVSIVVVMVTSNGIAQSLSSDQDTVRSVIVHARQHHRTSRQFRETPGAWRMVARTPSSKCW